MEEPLLHSPLEVTVNTAFWAAFWSWCSAQCIKMAIAFRTTRKIDLRYLGSTGGMPSAHSATVSGLATSIGLIEGFSSCAFALSMVFAIITMFDASTVRYQAGRQAEVINQINARLGREAETPQARLKELLGHTRPQVFAGMFWGILFATVYTVLSARLGVTPVD